MGNPPIALTLEGQKSAMRTRKARRCFVLLRARRHALLDAALQRTLAQSYCPMPTGTAPVDVGLWALALPVMAKRWQMGLDGVGAEQPPFSQGTLDNCRQRLIAHDLDKTLRDRTVALAAKTGGFGARPLRATWDSPPLFGAGRVEDPLKLLGHALRKAVGLVAQALGPSAAVLREEAGLPLGRGSSLKAALGLRWGEPGAQETALCVVFEEVDRWQRWLEQHPHLLEPESPLQEVRDTSSQIVAQDTEPDPNTGPGGRRITKQVAPERRISIADKDMRHGRKSRSQMFNGFKEHLLLDLASHVTRAVVIRQANEPAYEVVELLAAALESG